MKALTEKQVAEMTGLAPQTLRNQRFRGVGIPFLKIGSSVRYLEADVMKAIEKARVQTRGL